MDSTSTHSTPQGPMTRARVRALETEVTSLLSQLPFESDETWPDRGKGVPSFDEMVAIILVEVDFDDPTTNVRGRRALAIAKPTPRGY